MYRTVLLTMFGWSIRYVSRRPFAFKKWYLFLLTQSYKHVILFKSKILYSRSKDRFISGFNSAYWKKIFMVLFIEIYCFVSGWSKTDISIKNSRNSEKYLTHKSNFLYKGQFLGNSCKYQVRRMVNNEEIIKAIHNEPRSCPER